MSLWTPDGEHRVPRDQPTPAEPAATEPADVDDPLGSIPGFDELTPEQQQEAREVAAEMAEARRRVAEVPASDIVANHVMGLFELAAIHLSSEPPAPVEARLAIDAMTAVVQNLQGRLGEHEPVLRDSLQQIQIAFVQVSQAHADAADEADPDRGD
jgi:hypothetical protein